jgi:2-keto-myo-inositol isomerase
MLKKKYSLNRMIKPSLLLEEFFRLSCDTGSTGIELRNDILDGRILDGLKPEELKKMAEDYGQEIVSINAIQKFNLGARRQVVLEEVKRFIDISERCGCKMVVMCPNNEAHDNRSKEVRYDETVKSLNYIGKLLKNTSIIGLLEPLGFSISSLRYKKDAVSALKECDYSDCFKITHDTFHHYLSNDETFYPDNTGLIHVSGITEYLPMKDYTDAHRVLVTKADVMGNLSQIVNLGNNGYSGYISFEPFSEAVQNMPYSELVNQIRLSMDVIENATLSELQVSL